MGHNILNEKNNKQMIEMIEMILMLYIQLKVPIGCYEEFN